MQFSDKELEKLQALTNIYIQAKGIIIFSEEIDPESKSNLQIIKELRDAFDHLIRVFSNKFDATSERNEDYDFLNLDKALGHAYRAAYDAADGCALSLKEKILDTLKGHSSDVIVQVIQNYFDYKIQIEEISERIADHRTKKDSGEFARDVLSGYIEDLEKLKSIYVLFQNHMRGILELENDITKKTKKVTNKTLLITILAAIGGAILGVILTYLFFM